MKGGAGYISGHTCLHDWVCVPGNATSSYGVSGNLLLQILWFPFCKSPTGFWICPGLCKGVYVGSCLCLAANCFLHLHPTVKFKDEQVAFTECATRNMCDMGAGALFAAGRNVDIKVNTCSRALGISTQYRLVLPLLTGLLCFAFCL